MFPQPIYLTPQSTMNRWKIDRTQSIPQVKTLLRQTKFRGGFCDFLRQMALGGGSPSKLAKASRPIRAQLASEEDPHLLLPELDVLHVNAPGFDFDIRAIYLCFGLRIE